MKRLILITICLSILLGCLSPAIAAAQHGEYYPQYTGNGTLLEALNSLGIDSSFSHRASISEANGIATKTQYNGTYQQNITMLSLLKQGKLRNPDFVTNVTSDDKPYDCVELEYRNARVKTNLRSKPYSASSSLLKVAKGTTVAILEEVTNAYGNLWYRVTVDGTYGYIYSDKITNVHTHTYEVYSFNSIKYYVCACGDIYSNAKTASEKNEASILISSMSPAIPLVVADGPLPIGDIIAIGMMIIGVCIAHDYGVPTTQDLARLISEADFDEYLDKRKENSCSRYTFRKVTRFPGGLKYIDNYCMDAVEAYVYIQLIHGDVYVEDEDAALILASKFGAAVMERDKSTPTKDTTTYFYHFHVKGNDKQRKNLSFGLNEAHIFFGTNDRGEMPVE